MKIKHITICVGLAIGSLAHGEPLSEHTVANVQVVGIQESGNGITVERQDLDHAQTHDLKSMTRYQPGVSYISNPRGAGSFNIRGIDGNRVGMKVDGVDMPDGFFYWGHTNVRVPRDSIETDTIKQLDILQGADALEKDGADFGGSINMQTYDPQDFVSDKKHYAAGVKAHYHSENKDRTATVHGAAKLGAAAGLLMFTAGKAHETESMGKNDVDGSRRDMPNPMNSSRYNILAKLTLGEENHRLKLTAEHYQRKNDIHIRSSLGPIISRGRPIGTRTLAENSTKLQRSRFAVDYTWYDMPGWLDRFSASLTHQRAKYTDETTQTNVFAGGGATSLGSAIFSQNITTLNTELRGKIGHSFADHYLNLKASYQLNETARPEHSYTLRNGIMQENQGSPAKNMPDSDTTKITLSLMDKIDFHNGLSITPAVRFEHYRIKSKPDAAYLNNLKPSWIPDYKQNNITPSIRADYRFNPQTHAWFAYAHGIKNPPFSAMSGLFHPIRPPYMVMEFIPNPDLKKERSNSFDFGVQYKSEPFDLRLALYYTRYQNFIKLFGEEINPAPNLKLMTTNLDQLTTYGGEISGEYRFTPALYSRFALSWMGAKQKHPGEESAYSGEQPTKILLGLGYRSQRWGGNIDWTLVDKQKNAPNYRGKPGYKAPGYALLDLSAWFKPTKNITIDAAVNNALDKKYFHTLDIAWANGAKPSEASTQPGRNFSVGVNIRF